MNDLIKDLLVKGNGCHVNSVFYGCIIYADDVILLSPSLLGLQAMLDTCTQYIVSHNIVFNRKKSVYTIIGKLHNTQPAPIYLDGTILEYVTRFKYLGITFSSGRTLSVDTACIKRKFYSACNSVL